MRESNGAAHAPHAPHVGAHVINVVTRAAQLSCTIDLTDSSVDDRPCIEAVLNDSATLPGSTVYFPEGTYNLNSGSAAQPTAHIALTQSGVNLEGQSREKTIFKSSADDGGGSTAYYGINLLGVNNVVLKNFTLTNQWNKSYSTDTRKASQQAGGLTYAIAMGYHSAPTHHVTIDNVLVEKFRRMGVRVGPGSYDVVVQNSLARNATDVAGGGTGYGFVIQGAAHQTANQNPFLGDPSKDTYFVTLQNNQTTGPHIRHAVIVQYWAHNNLVTHNTFSGTQLDAIDLHGEDEYANEVSYNTVNASLAAGVGLGNSGAGHDKTGVYNWIHHNDLIACHWGITVDFGTSESTIENNTMRNNANSAASHPGGVVLGKSSNSVLRNNVFLNNTVAGYVAVKLKDNASEGDEPAGGPTHWVISGNVVSHSGAALRNSATMDADNTIQSSWSSNGL